MKMKMNKQSKTSLPAKPVMVIPAAQYKIVCPYWPIRPTLTLYECRVTERKANPGTHSGDVGYPATLRASLGIYPYIGVRQGMKSIGYV